MRIIKVECCDECPYIILLAEGFTKEGYPYEHHVCARTGSRKTKIEDKYQINTTCPLECLTKDEPASTMLDPKHPLDNPNLNINRALRW